MAVGKPAGLSKVTAMKTADGQSGRRDTLGREQMNLGLSAGITGQPADGLCRNVG